MAAIASTFTNPLQTLHCSYCKSLSLQPLTVCTLSSSFSKANIDTVEGAERGIVSLTQHCLTQNCYVDIYTQSSHIIIYNYLKMCLRIEKHSLFV